MILSSSLSYYIDAYIFLNGTIPIAGAGADDTAKQVDKIDKGSIFQNSALFTIDAIIPMYNLIEYGDSYSKASGNLWQYYRAKWYFNKFWIIEI